MSVDAAVTPQMDEARLERITEQLKSLVYAAIVA